jgi:hypothetical protein
MPPVEISYGLERVSRQWQLKLKSQLDIWIKENKRTIAFVQSYRMKNLFPNPVYVDDILLASSDVNLLHEKKFLSSSFNENDLGKASFILRIRTYRNRRKGVLEISQMHK